MNKQAGDNPWSEIDESPLIVNEPKMVGEEQPSKLKGWCLFQIINTLYVGFMAAVFYMSKATGYPWIGELVAGLVLAAGVVFSMGFVIWSIKERIRERRERKLNTIHSDSDVDGCHQ